MKVFLSEESWGSNETRRILEIGSKQKQKQKEPD